MPMPLQASMDLVLYVKRSSSLNHDTDSRSMPPATRKVQRRIIILSHAITGDKERVGAGQELRVPG